MPKIPQKNKRKKQPYKTPQSTLKAGLLFFKSRTSERNPELILSTTIAWRHRIFQRHHAKVPSVGHTVHHYWTSWAPSTLPEAASCVESTDEVLSFIRHLLWMQQRNSLASQTVPSKSDMCPWTFMSWTEWHHGIIVRLCPTGLVGSQQMPNVWILISHNKEKGSFDKDMYW